MLTFWGNGLHPAKLLLGPTCPLVDPSTWGVDTWHPLPASQLVAEPLGSELKIEV